MEPRNYYVIALALSSLALAVSAVNLLILILDRRTRLEITPCRVRPLGASGDYVIIPLHVMPAGRQGIDFMYSFLLENRGRRALCITSCWEIVRSIGEGQRIIELRGRIVNVGFPCTVEAGNAVLAVMNREWGVNEGEMHVVVQQVGGEIWRHRVCSSMQKPLLDT